MSTGALGLYQDAAWQPQSVLPLAPRGFRPLPVFGLERPVCGGQRLVPSPTACFASLLHLQQSGHHLFIASQLSAVLAEALSVFTVFRFSLALLPPSLRFPSTSDCLGMARKGSQKNLFPLKSRSPNRVSDHVGNGISVSFPILGLR